ncbi:unnamed protein product [Vitrella brassicaformis CCMP3155]|uniref:Uncharacterized protein n=1 Tax=Vitrella brassicaformis (strain CCMP3155) TaxID=1169540 RepID=A0A0G4GF44_VITBC|nr:unnamed protein product [Vitrella brassicaformis CCMP3155]|eukprot:CEM28110.1 unnamed protein product [Vitrella brassicaformis CCMP3155]
MAENAVLLERVKRSGMRGSLEEFRGRRVAFHGAEVIFTAADGKDLREIVADPSAVEQLTGSAVKRLTTLKTRFDITPFVCFEGDLRAQENENPTFFLRCWGNRDIFSAQRKIGQQMQKALEGVGIYCVASPGYASMQCGYFASRMKAPWDVSLVVGMHYDLLVWDCPLVMYAVDEDGRGLLVELSQVIKDMGLKTRDQFIVATNVYSSMPKGTDLQKVLDTIAGNGGRRR